MNLSLLFLEATHKFVLIIIDYYCTVDSTLLLEFRNKEWTLDPVGNNQEYQSYTQCLTVREEIKECFGVNKAGLFL